MTKLGKREPEFFLKLILWRHLYVCVCLCVCQPPRLLIIKGVI